MNIIDKIYERNFEFVRGFDIHTGVKESVADIYPDKAHFIYELLQNAEDTGATETSIELYENKLVFIHNGRSFNEADIEGICTIGASNKKDDETTIGKFGVGFKSVFLYTNSPNIWSEKFNFKIENLILPYEIKPNTTLEGTTFEFPFNNQDKPKNIAFSEIKESLDEISKVTLLFLNNIKLINIKIKEKNKEVISKISKTDFKNNLVKVNLSNNIISNDNTFYLVFSKQSEKILQKINVAFQLNFKKNYNTLLSDKNYSDQFNIVEANPGSVSVSFPLAKETSKLKFFLNAPFITDRARSSLKNNETNESFFKELHILFFNTIVKLKEMNFLNREFFEILPISRDELNGQYEQLRIAIINILKENSFLKTECNNLVKSHNLFKGNREIRDLLSKDDLNIIFNNNEIMNYWAMPVNISSRVNILYNDLNVKNFDDHDFLEWIDNNAEIYHNFQWIDYWTSDICDDDFMEWLSTKDISWHQKFFSYLYSLEEYGGKKIDQFNIDNWLIFRLKDKTFSNKVNLFFPSNLKDKTYKTIDNRILNEGSSKSLKANIENFLKYIGIREFDIAAQVQMIIDSRYNKVSIYPEKKFHPDLKDIKIFLRYFASFPNKANLFSKIEIFLNDKEQFCRADQLFIDSNNKKGFREYIGLINGENENEVIFSSLSKKYNDLNINILKLQDFAIAVGAQNSLTILKFQIPYSHPEFNSLFADRNKTVERYETSVNKDYFIQYLESKVLQSKISKDLSLMIWSLINKEFKENFFLASYRPNKKFSIKHATSTLMIGLRDNKWLYNNHDEYLRPSDLSEETLNSIYSFNKNWQGLKYLEFGKNEQKNLEVQESINDAIKKLGIKEDFVDILKQIQEKFSVDEISALIEKESLNKETSGINDKKVKNPELRSKRVKEQADEAPDRFFEIRKRSVPTGASAETKNLATKYLIQEYTHEEGLLCQICNKEVPFKLNNGNFYFEKVRFLDNLKRDHQYNFIALCANHSAMFQYTLDENENLVDKIKNIKSNNIKIKIGQSLHKIYFTNKHILDLKAIIESENK